MESPSSNLLARRPGVVLATTLALMLLLSVLHVQDHGFLPLMDHDTEKRAGSARHLLQTGRWAAEVLHTWELVGHNHEGEDRPWPVQVWSLGYPLLLTGAFAVFGARDLVTVALPILAYLGCVVLAFLLARRLWGATVAGLTCLLLLAENTLIYWSAHATLEPVFVLFLLGAIWLLVSRPVGWGAAALAGVLVGVAYFLRPTALAWTPFLLLAGWESKPGSRWSRKGVALGGLVAVMLAAWLLTRALAVPPLPSHGPSISYLQGCLRDGTPDRVIGGVTEIPRYIPTRELLRPEYLAPRAAGNLVRGVREIATQYPWSLLLLGGLGLVLALADPRARRVAQLTLVVLLVAFMGTVMTVGASFERYFSDFAPLLAVFGGRGLLWGWKRVANTGVAGKVVFVLVACALLAQGFANYRMPFHRGSAQAEPAYLGREVAVRTPSQAIIGSLSAVPISWHAQRRAVQIPHPAGPDPTAALLELDQELIRLDGLVLAEEDLPGELPARIGPFEKTETFGVPRRWGRGPQDQTFYTLYRRVE